MDGNGRERRLKMKARRRSPVMLAFGVLTALGTAPVAVRAEAFGLRRPSAWREVPDGTAPGEPLPPAAAGPPAPPPPPSRLQTIFQAGWQHTWPSTRLWDSRSHSLFSLDLGMTVRGDDGHRWGGAATGFWYAGYRRNLALKAIRRWTLEATSGSYAQLAPGVLVTGDDEQVRLHPGLLLEAELGNGWVALTTGVHAQPWTSASPAGPQEMDIDLTWTLGGRVHGAIGAGVLVALYLAVAVAFASGGGGWG